MRQVYPRVGGGNASETAPRKPHKGLSPRGRGKPSEEAHAPSGRGSIPAWAGETGRLTTGGASPKVYPRVGGGNDGRRKANIRTPGLSPRGRGKRAPSGPVTFIARSIPAWAGETLWGLCAFSIWWVYPRVGGGN